MNLKAKHKNSLSVKCKRFHKHFRTDTGKFLLRFSWSHIKSHGIHFKHLSRQQVNREKAKREEAERQAEELREKLAKKEAQEVATREGNQ